MNRTLVAGAIAAVGVVGLAQPAHAESYPTKAVHHTKAHSRFEPESRAVRFGDLNLQNEAGAATLERRLRFAANQVCGGAIHGRVSLSYRSAHRACVREALENALAQVDSPLVLARFDDITHRNTFSTAFFSTQAIE